MDSKEEIRVESSNYILLDKPKKVESFIEKRGLNGKGTKKGIRV